MFSYKDFNNNIIVKVKKLYEDATLPEYATEGSAGLDLRAYLGEEYRNTFSNDKYVNIQPGERIKIGTGLAFQLPEDHVMMIYLRSSAGIKKYLRLQNGTGILDSDYNLEAFLFLENTNIDEGEYITVEHGERIAQAIILPYPKVTFDEVENLDVTNRSGGFGSTGRF